MKIAILANNGQPLNENSENPLEIFLKQLLGDLLKAEHEVSVFADKDSSIYEGFFALNAGAIDWKHQKNQSTEFKTFIENQHAYNEVFNFIEETGYDVILNFTDHPWPIFNGRFLDSPMITVLNNSPSPELQSAVKLNQVPGSYFMCTSYHFQSEWSAHSQINDIIPLGIDVDSQNFSKVTEENRAVWRGDIKRDTGLEDALQVCKQNYWNLCIIGEIKNQEYFDYIIKPYLKREDIHLHPDKDALTCENYLSHAEVSLITQDTPATVDFTLKSLAHGTPVAAYPISSIKEYLPEGIGKQTQNTNIAELAYAGKITRNYARLDCRNFIESYYSTDKQVEKFRAFLKRIVEYEKPVKEISEKLA